MVINSLHLIIVEPVTDHSVLYWHCEKGPGIKHIIRFLTGIIMAFSLLYNLTLRLFLKILI